MIIRIECLPGIYRERLYDLSDGSLKTNGPIGLIYGDEDREVWSAEAFLCDIENYYESGNIVNVIITGFKSEDVEFPGPDQDTVPQKAI